MTQIRTVHFISEESERLVHEPTENECHAFEEPFSPDYPILLALIQYLRISHCSNFDILLQFYFLYKR